jgi:outer membrane immunogenic protein
MNRKLKQVLLASTLCVLPFAAKAADMPMKAPPMRVVQPVPFSWTGFYVGGSAGLISQNTVGTDLGDGSGGAFWNTAGDQYGIPGISGLVGVNVGYNYQLSNNIVLGIEADIAWSGLNNSYNTTSYGLNCEGGCTLSVGSKLEALGTVRARIGYAFDRALLYATGGLAFGKVKNYAFDLHDPTYNANTDSWRTGWTAGGGLEYAVTNNWTVRVEALYVDLGTTSGSISGCSFGFKNQYTLGRFGLNYKF